MAKLKKHWAHKMLTKRINRLKNGPLLPKFLRLPTVVEMGKSNSEALPMEGFGAKDGDYTWKQYRVDMKKHYPIKYFIYETLPLWFSNNIVKPISDVKYYIVSHTIRKYHLLDLRSEYYPYKFGWVDSDSQMLLAMMKIMENFIIEQDTENRLIWLKEELLNQTDDKWHIESVKKDIERCEELLAIQKWWRVDRVKKYEELYTDCGKINKVSSIDYFEKENALYKEDDDMMKKLIDMRDGMWT